MSFMVKKEIQAAGQLLEIEIPPHLLGKDVEIIIREKETKKEKNELDEFFSRYNYDLSGLVFDRAELHER
ncbi:MAG: hypothetical protein KAW12_13710 [Candidatus Aminicenantes bacterium]|nr:hypothetical protein [Candidatus Aminicenantes bacterium]